MDIIYQLIEQHRTANYFFSYSSGYASPEDLTIRNKNIANGICELERKLENEDGE